MAGDAVIGALRVVLGADTAAFEDGMKKVATRIGVVAGLSASAGKLIGDGLIQAFRGIAKAIPDAIDNMEGLAKTSEQLGIPAERLSELRYAAELSETSFESLEKGLVKLSRSMVDAAAKPTSEAANAFRALGVAVRDSTTGQLRELPDVLSSLSDRFATMDDGATKAALATKLLGKGGAELIPFLNLGSVALAEMAAEAAKFGIVVTTEAADAADNFNDRLTSLGKVKQGIILTLTAGMLPALNTLAEHLKKTALESGVVQSVSNSLLTAFNGLVRAVIFVYDNFSLLITALKVFVAFKIAGLVIAMTTAFIVFARAVIAAGLAKTLFNAAALISIARITAFTAVVLYVTGSLPSFNEALGKITDTLGKMATALGVTDALKSAADGLGVNFSGLTKQLDLLSGALPKVEKGQKDVNISLLGGKNALEQFILSQEKQNASALATISSSGALVGETERLRVAQEASTIATENGIKITESMRQKLIALGNQAALTAQQLHGVQVIQANRTPAEQYIMDIANAELGMRALGKTSEEIGPILTMIAERYGQTWAQVSADTTESFSRLADSFGKENRQMAVAAKALAIASAVINSYLAFTKALASGVPPYNYIAAAGVLAAGLATVNNIRSQSIPGFQAGASFQVPGGLGGGDRFPFQAMLEPGEQVDIMPNKHRGGDQRGPREITIRFEGDDFAIGQKIARKIGQALNEAVGDGLKLRIA